MRRAIKKFFSNLWGISIHPIRTFRKIQDVPPILQALLVIVVAVIGYSMFGWLMLMSPWLSLKILLLFLIVWLVLSASAQLFGRRILKGQGRFKQMLACFAFAFTPLIFLGFYQIFHYLCFLVPGLCQWRWAMLLLSYFPTAVLLWMVGLQVIAVRETQKFSYWRAIIALPVPYFLSAITYIILAQRTVWPSPMYEPGIAYAKGNCIYIATKDTSSAKVAFPIPLEFEEQVPIYLGLKSKPADSISGYELKKRNPHDWIAELSFKPLKEKAKISLEWKAWVLIRDKDYSKLPKKVDIPKKEELPKKVKLWLAATRCVQCDHAEIVVRASQIKGKNNNMIEVTENTLKFLRKLRTVPCFKSLDAVEALHKGGSCTSFANLAAALLRANGIPTRILAVYPTNSSLLQTHYIVEIFVPNYGWVWIESTFKTMPWKPYREVVVCVVYPKDEDKSFIPYPKHWAAKGVSFLSLDEPISKGYIRGGGMHEAGSVKMFQDDKAKMEKAFELTKRLWNYYLKFKGEKKELPQALATQRAAALSQNLAEYLENISKAQRIYVESRAIE